MNFRSDTNMRACDNVREELLEFVQSQYAASPTIKYILSAFRKEISALPDLEVFYTDIFDINTAQGFGLDVWGNILDIKRTIVDPDTGYQITLSDAGYRQLLFYKALANIMQATTPTLNRMIRLLYPNSKVYVLLVEKNEFANGVYYNRTPMYIRWNLEKFISDEERAIFKVAGTLCKGAGVGWHMYSTEEASVFGFDGGNWQPFNQGSFDPYGLIGG